MEQSTDDHVTNLNQREEHELDYASHLVYYRYYTAALGSPIPLTLPIAEIRTVLDVDCNLGGWMQDAARICSYAHVTGIEQDAHLLKRATLLAQVNGVRNVTLLSMDTSAALLLPDAHFDFVHRGTATFTFPARWSTSIGELMRVLRPAGWLNLVEIEHGLTSSEAFNALHRLIVRATTSTTSPVRPAQISNAPLLYGLLLHAGLLDVSYTLHVVDLGVGNTPGAREFVHEMLKTTRSFKTLLLQRGELNGATFDTLFAQAQQELLRPDSCGYAYIISALGRKNG